MFLRRCEGRGFGRTRGHGLLPLPVVPILVAAREKTLDLAAYRNPTGDLLAEPPAAPAGAPAPAAEAAAA